MAHHHIIIEVVLPDELDLREVLANNGAGAPPHTVADELTEVIADCTDQVLDLRGVWRTGPVTIRVAEAGVAA